MACYYVSDPLYSPINKVCNALLWKINLFIFKYFPILSVTGEFVLHLATIKRIVTLAMEEKVDILHLNTQIARDFFWSVYWVLALNF